MEVDDESPESITALIESLAPPWQLYLLLPTLAHNSNVPSAQAQESSAPSLTTWKIVEQCFLAKKGKGKAKEPEPSTTADEQIALLLQQLHKAEVPEDINANVLKNSMVQLALAQVLNELDIV
ncbi:hypothetical protein C0989_004807 [Termitomyces sp. Mn162]|nr:hypothetical protein C0989_004807 [Termitomyces sp. Mn162]